MLVFRALTLFISFALRQHHIFLASETLYFLFLFPLSISYLNVKKILSLDRDLSEQGGFSYESVYNGPISLPYDTLITLVSCRFLSLFRQRYDPSVVFLSIRDLTQQDGLKTQDGRMTKNVAQDRECTVSRHIFSSFCRPESLAVLLQKVPLDKMVHRHVNVIVIAPSPF